VPPPPECWHLCVVLYDLGFEDCSDLLTELVRIKKWYEFSDQIQWSVIAVVIWASLGSVESWLWAFRWGGLGEDTPEWGLTTSQALCFLCGAAVSSTVYVLISKWDNTVWVPILDPTPHPVSLCPFPQFLKCLMSGGWEVLILAIQLRVL